MSTTKLTRKQMVAEDSVHGSIVRLFEFCQENRAKIGILVLGLVVVILGIYGVYRYRGSQELKAQEQLGKGIEFYSAQVSPDATEDPYGKGAAAVFKSDSAKYQAASREFAAIASGHASGSVRTVARYYLGLAQLQLGQKQEAVKNLEAVSSKNSTIGFLAKKVLSTAHAGSGNYKEAQDILAGMIKDSKCDLPKEELSIQLSRVLVAQGKQADAVKVLREANDQGPAFGSYKQQVIAELERLQKAPQSGPALKPVQP